VAEDRDKFSQYIGKTSGLIMPSSSLYDNLYDLHNSGFSLWERAVKEYKPPASKKFN